MAELEAAVLQEMRRADLPSPTKEKRTCGAEVVALEGCIEDVRSQRERLAHSTSEPEVPQNPPLSNASDLAAESRSSSPGMSL
ncbi:hypothetical protein [Methylobacterium sp. 285MFTsu5.1]|uniref:hypothetical protein n=1 Tax=Methylobacterium sp. 285MFTsu5.1 TaxID=1172187 RepID=UPI00131A330A|nr:hypothetical protein [Methylobacterium sp. 285MFTsu5.1]